MNCDNVIELTKISIENTVNCIVLLWSTVRARYSLVEVYCICQRSYTSLYELTCSTNDYVVHMYSQRSAVCQWSVYVCTMYKPMHALSQCCMCVYNGEII